MQIMGSDFSCKSTGDDLNELFRFNLNSIFSKYTGMSLYDGSLYASSDIRQLKGGHQVLYLNNNI